MGILIGELARRARVKPQTIRYYEALGVLTRPERSAAGYRRYPERAVEELAFIRKAQRLGFSLDDIKQVLDVAKAGQQPCSKVLAIAEEHLAQLDERIKQLTRLRTELARALGSWRTGGAPSRCASTLCGLINEAAEPIEDGAALFAAARDLRRRS